MRLRYITFFLISLLAIVSCKNNDEKPVDNLLDTTEVEVSETGSVRINEIDLEGIIKSIPSPVEVSSLIKATGYEYNSRMLNSTNNVANYGTNNEKALAIGVYGADLGYINIYEKTYNSLEYLDVIKSLADNIKVGEFFDFQTLKRLARSNKDVDSLVIISTNSFNNMDDYLRQQNRNNLSVLMASGAWMEGLFITISVIKENNSPDLKERVGEQKPILDSLIRALSVYDNNAYVNSLLVGFQTIQKEYENVKLTYSYKEPELVEVDGALVSTDKSKSNVEITEEEVKRISDALARVRNNFIK